ncbi:unnamed protein product, partial [Ilex paraguariensis]
NERAEVERDSVTIGGDIENERAGAKRNSATIRGDIENVRVGALTDNETSDGSDFHDSEYDVEEDEKMFETYVDMDVEWASVPNIGKGVEKEKSIDHGDAENDEVESDYRPSNELLSIDGFSLDKDSNKRRMPKYPEFRAETDMKNPTFKLGMLFGSPAEFIQLGRENK